MTTTVEPEDENNQIEKVDPVTGELMVPALADPSDIIEIMADNLAGESLGQGDLERIKIPTGGAVSWTTEEGEVLPMIEGVIIHHRIARSYWSKRFEESGGGTPPDCTNNDIRVKPEVGVGSPGGPCDRCPKNQFGADGEGKPCKQTHLLFVLKPGEILPTVITASPGSLQAIKKYMTRLGGKRLSSRHVTSRLGLERVQNRNNLAYSRVLPLEYTVLPAEERAQADNIYNALQPILDTITVDRSEVDGPDNLTRANDGYHNMEAPGEIVDAPPEEMTEADRDYYNALGRVREEATSPPWDGPGGPGANVYGPIEEGETPIVSELRETVETIATEEVEKAKTKRGRKSAVTMESLEQILTNNQWTMAELCGVILEVKDWDEYAQMGGTIDMAAKKFQDHLAGRPA